MSYPNAPFVFNAQLPGASADDKARIANIEDKYVRTTRFAIISSGTSGSITPPTNSTIILDDFGGTVDAVITTTSGGRPTYNAVIGVGGSQVATTFDSSGNYTLSDAPTSYPVALVYRVKQKLVDFDSNSSDIIGSPQVITEPSDATATVKGIIKLAGDLSGTADLPTVPDLANKENLSNKATDLTSPDNTKYPTTLAVSDAIANIPAGSASALTTTVYNQTGASIPKGSVVYINGAHGNLPTITLSQANSEANSSKTYGLVRSAIGNNSSGVVVHSGLIGNLNTFGIAEGVSLWLSPTIAGGYTTTKPSAPNHTVFIGVCTRAHPTQGTIEVTIQNGFELQEIHNVSISSPANEQVLQYESASSLWKNVTLAIKNSGLMNTAFNSKVVSLTDAANIATDVSLGNIFSVTLGGNRTLSAPTGMGTSRQRATWIITQDATGGRTLAYDSAFNFGLDLIGVSISSEPNASSYIGAIYNPATSNWDVISILRGY